MNTIDEPEEVLTTEPAAVPEEILALETELEPLPEAVPDRARVVVVGGGIAGCSVAYHLAREGWRDVVLLEQATLGGGTTWQAAGMVSQYRSSNCLTRVNKCSVELYRRLEAESGMPPSWDEVGGLVLAQTPSRLTELRRTAAMAACFGVDTQILSAGETAEKFPMMRTDDLSGALWLPQDGRIHPEATVQALVECARTRGVQFREHVRVTGLELGEGAVRGVTTDSGRIAAEYVVLCCGMWTRELALDAGIVLPLQPVEQHYVLSEPLDGAPAPLPCTHDPDSAIYFRGAGDRLLLGGLQAHVKAWTADPLPHPFSYASLPPDWDGFERALAAGRHRIPKLEKAGFEKFVNGPESVTPDGNFLLGEAPEVDRLYVCAGFNASGLSNAGGAGKYLAEWIISGEPTIDLWPVDISRFAHCHNNRHYLRERVREVPTLHYGIAWPNREFETVRNVRRSALHDKLAAAGACFGEKMALELPNWFARSETARRMDYTFARPQWLEHSGREHRAAREHVALFDQSSLARFRLEGPDALTILQRLCGANINVAPGRAVYTGMFNVRGTYESDLTVLRLSEDAFYIITSAAQARHDAHWIARNTGPGERAVLTDVTSACGVLGVMGPESRTLLQRVTDIDLRHVSFPYGTARTISIGTATALALRITYVGELGWELHVDADQLVTAYEAILAAGRDLEVCLAGQYALNSLRLEKGYRAWGAELTCDDTPFEAGLSFTLCWEKETPFVGHDALLEKWEAIPKKRLASLVLEEPSVMLWGGEPVFRDGTLSGYTTSGAFGHTLGSAVALGYIQSDEGTTPASLAASDYTILVDGVQYGARIGFRAPYDPARRKILC